MLWFFLEDKSLKQVFNWLHSGLVLQGELELVLAFARRLQVRPEWQGLPLVLLLVQRLRLPG